MQDKNFDSKHSSCILIIDDFQYSYDKVLNSKENIKNLNDELYLGHFPMVFF